MKRYIHASSTRSKITDLENRIAEYEQYIENCLDQGVDPEDLIDYYQSIEELKDELRFAWAEDEQEYIDALQAQEFNPDGSLKYYD